MTTASSQFFAILTAAGEAKQANANALGIPWTFAQMGVGDANLTDPIPDRMQTRLINERRRAPLNQVKVDPSNASIIIAEQVIPPDVGGWWIREIGLYDADGDLVAVANCAPSFKPLLTQGTGKTQVVRLNLIVASTANVQLKIDPAVVLATREYVDSSILTVLPKDKVAGTYTQVQINERGLVQQGLNPTTLKGYGIKDAQPLHGILTALVENNAYGIGQAAPQTVRDSNTALLPGFYSPGGAVGINFADPYAPMVVLRREGGTVAQLQAFNGTLAFRGSIDNGATWSEWDFTWHTGNLIKGKSALDVTEGVMLSLGMYGLGKGIINAEVDMNKYLVPGNYVTPVSGLLNLPEGWSSSTRYSLVVDGYNRDNYLAQTLKSGMVSAAVTVTATRTMVSSGVFTDWVVQVSDADKATQEHAETGTNNSKWMTPLRVFQAIGKVVKQATETAFGWAKVATQVQTSAGVDDTTIVTPKKLLFGFYMNLIWNGYIVFPKFLGGLIIQWGTTGEIAANGTLVQPLPMAFPTVNLVALCMAQYSSAPNAAHAISIFGRTSTDMTFYNSNGTVTPVASWIAIGI